MLRKLFAKLIGSKKARKGKPARAKKTAAPKKKTAAKRKKPAQRKGASKPRAKRRKPAASKKTPPAKAKAPGKEIGRVVAFFRIPVVAVIRITGGRLKTGDRIWIKGHTTDLKQTVASMQVDHKPVQQIRKGGEAGVKVSGRVRRGDRVYRV